MLNKQSTEVLRDGRKLTVVVEAEGESVTTVMDLMRCVRELCGGLLGCRYLTENKFEMTMSHPRGKERLMEGFKMGETRVHAREIVNDELVVSFMNLPFYVEDQEILEKLRTWGVSAASPIKRRMWPGTNVADGTRFLKVKFNNQVQSLPYSAKFSTALGAEYFRVIHDKQARVCRMCIQPGHLMRECPEFQCHRCGVQGHFARECGKDVKKCDLCRNRTEECRCNRSETEEGKGEEVNGSEEGSESESSEEGDSVGMESIEEEHVQGEVTVAGTRGGLREEREREEDTMKIVADVRDGERAQTETTKGERGREEKLERQSSKERGRRNDAAAAAEGRRDAQTVRTEEKGSTDGRRGGVENADLEAKERMQHGDEKTEERREVQSGVPPTGSVEDTHTSQTAGSETDMELLEEISLIRKRQNTERHKRISKKSKSKNKK